MECQCLSFREIPHTTRLFADFLYDFPRVKSFYNYDPFDADSYRRAAERIFIDSEQRRSVASVLAEQNQACGADRATQENIQRLTTGQAVAVVTGQQVGLYGGPAFSVYKALTAIGLAQKLAAEGLPAVPIFWLAGEDHDWSEVDHCVVLDGEQQVQRFEYRPRFLQARVGETRLDEGAHELQARLQALWKDSADVEHLNHLVSAYRADVTLADAFATLLHRVLAGTGIITLNPLDSRLSRLVQPLLQKVLEQSETAHRRLRERQEALEAGGYHVQVRPRENATLLFLTADGARRPIRRRGEGYAVEGRGVLSPAALRDELEAHPERFSPNVLLRPLVQDALLPTVCYVGGPAEIAYLAQASALYDDWLGRMPVVAPRASFTLVSRSLQRLLSRYHLRFCDVFQSRAALFTAMARQRLPARLRRRLDVTERRLEALLSDVSEPLAALDSTLTGAVETSRRKMLYQFHKLAGKAARAQAERAAIVERHLEKLMVSLYPNRGLQERTYSYLSFLMQYGLDLTPRLAGQIRWPCREHQVLYLDR